MSWLRNQQDTPKVVLCTRYPRKPRGVARRVVDDSIGTRLSFCCAREGCRRRHTPASVRFLCRRVFLGAVVVLVTALSSGLTGKRGEPPPADRRSRRPRALGNRARVSVQNNHQVT